MNTTPAPADRTPHYAEQLAASLPPLLVAAERVAATIPQGVHGRRRVGQGESFWQFRPYEIGDPTTAIDWRRSAKSGNVFIREMEWEAAQSVWLWRDASASMHYRSHRRLDSKAERADLLLLALASLLMRGGERFALLGAEAPPSTGRAALNRLSITLARESAAGQESDEAAPIGSMPPAQALPRHAQVVLIGDFLVPIEEAREVIVKLAARGVKGHMLQILDPAEETLPFRGRVRFSGFEGEADTLLGRVEALRADYGRKLAAHQAALRDFVRRAGWGFAVHRTDSSAQSALMTLHQALAPRIGG